MDLEGFGILALWNGADPERSQEYNLWHSREHVPERLSVPGMRSARRYVRTSGDLPEYLTLYEMTDVSVLSSPPYLKLLNHPTEWSRSMRPSFRGFLRVCCNRVATFGGGMGTVLAAIVIEDGKGVDLTAPALQDLAARIVASPSAVTASHIIQADPRVPTVPFQINGDRDAPAVAGVLLLEGFDRRDLAEALKGFGSDLSTCGVGPTTTRLGFYGLAYGLTIASLGKIRTLAATDYLGCPPRYSIPAFGVLDQE